jgi:molybdenum cofactor cytidylyltransferase
MAGVAQRLTDAFFDAVRRKIEAREFWFGPVPIEEAEGRILGHNVAGPDGRPLLRKGRPLTPADLASLRGLGHAMVYVADPGPNDVDEDTAARRVAEAAAGPELHLSGTASGRVNVLAAAQGILRVDPARLARLNEVEGVTVATLASGSVARARQVVATVKIVPYALPEEALARAAKAASEGGPLLKVDVLPSRSVALILSGSPRARDRVVRDFEGPLRARVEALGSVLQAPEYVPLEQPGDEEALAEALKRSVAVGAGLLILAGETAIVDRRDIAPRAVERAGGEVACFGAPVDPGNLLLLAFLGDVPVLGAPGCARSPRENVIDWVLPRLLAGERLGKADLVAMGHGGLLEDVPERPMPRDTLT